MKSVTSAALILTFLSGVNCLPSYGLLSNIKPSRIEAQSIAQGNNQQFNHRVKTTLDTQFNLKYGQIAYLQNENIEIKFSKVIQDSRCPSNVNCIWQGQVVIELDIIKNGKKVSTLTLTLIPGRDVPPIQFLDKYTVTLRDVLPYPKSGINVVTKDYIARIVVAKGLPSNKIPTN
ncbi:MAG: hypothetical protein V7L01_24535 [Nostoc sp.]|uniref:hypothetical protein n=1 Tax=Nostoc sp. TaxID=1180 RepID=UPI002FFCDBAC